MEEELIKKDKKKSDNGKIKIIVIIGIIILTLVIIFAIYFIKDINSGGNITEDIVDKDNDELTNKLDVYKNVSGLLCKEKNDDCKVIAYSILVENTDAKVITFDNDNLFILYKDGNELKFYDTILEESQSISLESVMKDYQIYLNENKDLIVGIVYKTKDDKIGFFDLQTGKKLYEGMYDNIEFVNENQLKAYKGNESYLLNIS